MKYIRTKDKIFEYTSHSKAFDGVYTTTMGVNHLILFNEIVNQADTIEKLCDEFVAIRKDNVRNVMFLAKILKARHGKTLALKTDLFLWKKPLIKSIKTNFQVYGAIWTEWGLKYVAKMNEKGELELL